HFFQECAVGLGSIALASLFNEGQTAAKTTLPNPMAPRKGHFPARAKNVIFLFMAGCPGQKELFYPKPKLPEMNGQPIPEEFVKGKRFAFMSSFFGKDRPKLLGSRRKFAQHGKSGAWVSECLPHIAGVADDIAIVRSMATNVFNHAPAKLFLMTGS